MFRISLGNQRSKTESIFKDELLFSQQSTSHGMSPSSSLTGNRKSLLTNDDGSVSTDSLNVSEMEETKELVLKCHQPDKNKYMIAFDASQEATGHQNQGLRSSSRLLGSPLKEAGLHDSISLNNYLTASLYRLARGQQSSKDQEFEEAKAKKKMDNNLNGNPHTDEDDNNSSGTLTNRTVESSPRRRTRPQNSNHKYPQSAALLSSNPLTDDDDYHDQLEHMDDYEFERDFSGRRPRGSSQAYNNSRSPFIPIFDLQATSFNSPMTPVNEFPQSSQSRSRRRPIVSSTSESEEQSSFSSMVSSSDASSPLMTSPIRDTEPSSNTIQSNAMNLRSMQFYPRSINPNQQLATTGFFALDRLKQGASPIREEDEHSSGSSPPHIDINSNGSSKVTRRRSIGSNSQTTSNFTVRGTRNGFMNRPKSGSFDTPTSYLSRPYGDRDNGYYQCNPIYRNYRQNGSSCSQGVPFLQPRVQSNPYNPFDPTSLGYASRGQFQIRSAPQTPVTPRVTGFQAPPVYDVPSTANYAYRSRNQEPSTPTQAEQPQKKVYVCYPNYSLPDLSFLDHHDGAKALPTKDAEVLLSPTKPIGRSVPNPTQDLQETFHGAHNSRKQRPKSFNDIEHLTKSTIQGVKDWESLNFLLPQQVKTLMGHRGLFPVPETTDLSTTETLSSGNKENPAPTFVRLRHRILPRVPVSQKRRSLQEPFMTPCMTPSTANGLTRSESMPFHGHYHCPVISRGCCQANAHHCHGSQPTSCVSHSCCHTTSVCQSKPVDDSIDSLCNLLSMQAEMTEVGELFKKIWSGSDSSMEKKDLKKEGAIKPNTLNIRASAGFKSMIPVPKTNKSPMKAPPKVTPRRRQH